MDFLGQDGRDRAELVVVLTKESMLGNGVLSVFKGWQSGGAGGLGNDGQFTWVLFDLLGTLLLTLL